MNATNGKVVADNLSDAAKGGENQKESIQRDSTYSGALRCLEHRRPTR